MTVSKLQCGDTNLVSLNGNTASWNIPWKTLAGYIPVDKLSNDSTNRLEYLYGTTAGFTGEVTAQKLAVGETVQLGSYYLGKTGIKKGVEGKYTSWDDIIGGTVQAVFGA